MGSQSWWLVVQLGVAWGWSRQGAHPGQEGRVGGSSQGEGGHGASSRAWEGRVVEIDAHPKGGQVAWREVACVEATSLSHLIW